MTMIFNGTELEEVRFNGVDCEKVYFNGTLVFEKVVGNQYLLTVGKYVAWGTVQFGYDSLSDEAIEVITEGALIPGFIEELGQPVSSLHWWEDSGAAGVQINGMSEDFDYGGLWLLTIGEWEGTLMGFDDGTMYWDSYNYPSGGRPFTVADFDLLPKSGTHIVTLSKIA